MISWGHLLPRRNWESSWKDYKIVCMLSLFIMIWTILVSKHGKKWRKYCLIIWQYIKIRNWVVSYYPPSYWKVLLKISNQCHITLQSTLYSSHTLIRYSNKLWVFLIKIHSLHKVKFPNFITCSLITALKSPTPIVVRTSSTYAFKPQRTLTLPHFGLI